MTSVRFGISRSVKRMLHAVLVVCIPIIVIEMIALTGYRAWLLQFGLFPRNTHTWWHLFFMPFLHLSTVHAVGNVSVLSVLVGLLALRNINLLIASSVFIIVLGGMGVWLFGRPAIHVGASAWIFGLWGMVITRGMVSRCWRDVLVGLVVAVLYWRLVSGLFPHNPNTSIEGHWFGLLAGVLFGVLSKNKFVGVR